MGDEPQFAREIRMAKVQGLVLAKTVTYDLTITEQEISIVGRQVREKPINGRISGPTLTLAHRVRQIVSYLKIHSFELVGNQSWHFTGVLHPMKVIPPVERSVIREGILRELTAPDDRIRCRPVLAASDKRTIWIQFDTTCEQLNPDTPFSGTHKPTPGAWLSPSRRQTPLQ